MCCCVVLAVPLYRALGVGQCHCTVLRGSLWGCGACWVAWSDSCYVTALALCGSRALHCTCYALYLYLPCTVPAMRWFELHCTCHALYLPCTVPALYLPCTVPALQCTCPALYLPCTIPALHCTCPALHLEWSQYSTVLYCTCRAGTCSYVMSIMH